MECFSCYSWHEIKIRLNSLDTCVKRGWHAGLTAITAIVCPKFVATKPAANMVERVTYGGTAPWTLFLKTLCIFSKSKATLDKVSNGSNYTCLKELKNHSFISVETIAVKLL